jgi:hypothetical protein
VVGKGALTFFGWGLFSRQQWVKAFEDVRAVFAHSIVGKPVWQRMWSFKLKSPNE